MSEDEGIHVPYNRDLKPLEKLLSGVRRPGDFFVQAAFETAMPRVEVEGAGVLSFPVPEAQIRQIIAQASPAPFGRGEQTILDESVHKVWQLAPEKMRIGGKSWEKTFRQILEAVTDGLSCAEANISAELYKLLVYEKGGFFKTHRDTEKAAGMFGTMIVVLPSAHRGGELVIRHAGREVALDLSSAEVSELQIAAFYADCEQTSPAEPDYSDYDGGWYDEGPDEDASFEAVEVSDSFCHIGEWHDTEDHPAPFGDLPLEEGEVLPAGALDGEKPDEQRLMEATGNEGASFERSYHRAALVLWPRERFADVLLQGGVSAVLPHLAERVAGVSGTTAAARKPVFALARRVIDTWEEAEEHFAFAGPEKNPKRHEMVHLLTQLGDAGLLERFIGGVVTRRFDGSENATLSAAAETLGAQVSARLFTTLMQEKAPGHPGATGELLGSLLREVGEPLDAPWKKALTPMAAAIVAALPKMKPKPEPKRASSFPGRSTWTAQSLPQTLEQVKQDHGGNASAREAGGVKADFVSGLFANLRALGADQLRADATAAIAANVAAFDPVGVIVPALAAWQPSSKTAAHSADADWSRLWHHAAKFLLDRSEQPPAPPTDWKLKANIACPCADCRELQAFVRDPAAREHRFRVKKERRQHLHQTIEKHDLDMTHETERQGSPQTLVCLKTRRTYERQRARHQGDVAAMGTLAEIMPGASGKAASLLARMAAARQRKSQPA